MTLCIEKAQTRLDIGLDFFSSDHLDINALIESLHYLGELEVLNRTKNILQTKLDGVLLDFVDYSCYDWIDGVVVHWLHQLTLQL